MTVEENRHIIAVPDSWNYWRGVLWLGSKGFKVKLGYRKHKPICAELQEMKVFEMMVKLL